MPAVDVAISVERTLSPGAGGGGPRERNGAPDKKRQMTSKHRAKNENRRGEIGKDLFISLALCLAVTCSRQANEVKRRGADERPY